MVRPEFGRAFTAEGCCHKIFPVPVVTHAAEEGNEFAAVAVAVHADFTLLGHKFSSPEVVGTYGIIGKILVFSRESAILIVAVTIA